ncbi:MAG: hypothetical protein AMJ79_15440 [Phycisphaerae bacterium SM23_30]|nr:MAG: hypothetical protein AMJ79_15440 [Phycisphaerae bacterium SM23_30]
MDLHIDKDHIEKFTHLYGQFFPGGRPCGAGGASDLLDELFNLNLEFNPLQGPLAGNRIPLHQAKHRPIKPDEALKLLAELLNPARIIK